jgi:hypothetical protein
LSSAVLRDAVLVLGPCRRLAGERQRRLDLAESHQEQQGHRAEHVQHTSKTNGGTGPEREDRMKALFTIEVAGVVPRGWLS